MSETARSRTSYGCDAVASYCGFRDEVDRAYFIGLNREGRGPSYVEPSDRRVFFTRDAPDTWMAGWDEVIR